jgi:hypothetical protein
VRFRRRRPPSVRFRIECPAAVIPGKFDTPCFFVKTGTVQSAGFSQAKESLETTQSKQADSSVNAGACFARDLMRRRSSSLRPALIRTLLSSDHRALAGFPVLIPIRTAIGAARTVAPGRRGHLQVAAIIARTGCLATRPTRLGSAHELSQIRPNREFAKKSVSGQRFSTWYRTARIFRVCRRAPYWCCGRQITDDGHERHFAWNPSVWISRSNRTRAA